MTKKGRPSLREKVIAALPGTRAEIEKKSGVSEATVGKWLSILRAEGAVHIGKWRRAVLSGSKRPVFVLGAGVDAKPPKTLTPQQSQKRYRKRHPGRRAASVAAYYRRTQVRERGHGFLAALFF